LGPFIKDDLIKVR